MRKAVFLHGSTLRHVIIMTGASSIGLITLFAVDLVDMYFLSLLGQQELAAAIGFSGTLLFFLTAVSIGLQIAMGALVARAEGNHDRAGASRYCTNVMVFSALFSLLICLPVWFYLSELLTFLGAKGVTHALALSYSNIVLPSTPLLAAGMCAAAALRALGDARRSMYCTLGCALVNAVLDPIFIFGLGWGLEGAALASLCARIALFVIAFHGVWYVHRLPAAFRWSSMWGDMRAIAPIAGPALLTNLATPIGSGYVLKTMATYGDSAVAGAAIIGRIAPVAFAAIFSLSSAVGPIVGQNAAAGLYQRVRHTLRDALLLCIVYTLVVWALLFSLTDAIIAVFDAHGEAAALIAFYTRWLVGGFMFVGALFVANATFNNLQLAYVATCFNFGRMLFGTIPLVYLMSHWIGAPGVLAGELAGGMIFGSIAYLVARWWVARLEHSHHIAVNDTDAVDDNTQWAYCSQQTQLSQRCARPELEG
jgi:putative MATE family efflux protein